MSAPSPAIVPEGSSDRLDSWKEIAAYLKRGARTVQRWEREESLPVHRLVHQKLGSVYAFRSELDAWWRSRGAKLAAAESVSGSTMAMVPSTHKEDIAAKILSALGSAIAGNVVLALRKSPSRDVGADDFYRRGREYYYRFNPGGIEFAVEMFVRAIEIDPEYAAAWAGLADCWSFIYLYSERSEALREQSDWASQRALEMNPHLAQAHASRGLSLSLGTAGREASAAFETALQLDPGLFEAHFFYARYCFSLGRLAKAASLYEGAMRARDDDYQSPILAAQIFDDLGRPADAVAARRRGIERARLHPDDVRALYLSANGLVALGERERGRRIAERALDRRPDDGLTLYNVGCVYSLLGLIEPALDCLEKAAGAGIAQRAWYDRDSNLNPLREHPRFQELLGKL